MNELLLSDFKHPMMFFAAQIGVEAPLRRVFDTFEKNHKNSKLTPEQIKNGVYKTAINLGAIREFEDTYSLFLKMPKKRLSESETRMRMTAMAEAIGIPAYDMNNIYNKYDDALKKATTENERQAIAKLGLVEIHRLFGCHGGLSVDGELVIPPEAGYEEDNYVKKIQKIE